MMKRLVTIILAALFCFSLLPLFSQADEAEEDIIEKLWEEKRAYDYDGRYANLDNRYTAGYRYDETVHTIFWFLYTDTAKKYPLTWIFLSNEDYPEYEQMTDLQRELHNYEDKNGLLIYNNGVFYNPDLYKILKNRCGEPPLYALVKELHITREEMEIAVKRYFETPEYILGAFQDFDDYKSLSYSENLAHIDDMSDPVHSHTRFVLDALYLKDENAALALLLRPWALYIDGIPWDFRMMSYPGNDRISRTNFEGVSFDDLYTEKDFAKIDTHGLAHFVCFMREAIKTYSHNDGRCNLDITDGEYQMISPILDKLAAYLPAPPQTGARTGVYFAAAGLSALTLGAGALLLRRKKRRLDG